MEESQARCGLPSNAIILTLTFAAIYVVTYAERFSDDVWALRLGDCDLDFHANIHALALAYPGVDYVRLWPLPVEQP